jgi:hypothetical protein
MRADIEKIVLMVILHLDWELGSDLHSQWFYLIMNSLDGFVTYRERVLIRKQFTDSFCRVIIRKLRFQQLANVPAVMDPKCIHSMDDDTLPAVTLLREASKNETTYLIGNWCSRGAGYL